MENQIYRINMLSKSNLEIYVCSTNELNPYRKTKELGFQLIMGEKQLAACLDKDEIASFIKYLTDCKSYIDDFNSKSIPILEIK